MSEIRLVTRGSRLALVQCEMVEAAVAGVAPGVKPVRVVVRTTGDRRPDLSLARAGEAGVGLGLFTRELEVALLGGRADVAVHSLKDLPTELPAGLALVATLPRGPVADLCISRWPGGWVGLPEGARVGTSSVRRRRQLMRLRGDLRVEELRGNVPTRIGRLAGAGGLDAIVLAEAGLRRLGRAWPGGVLEGEGFDAHVSAFAPGEMLPAAGQGAIGLETRADAGETLEIVGRLNHAETYAAVSAERALLRLLGGGCQMPVGVLGSVRGGRLQLRGAIFPDSGEVRAGEVEGAMEDPGDAAERLFRLIA